MKFTAQLDMRTETNNGARIENFMFTECSGMCNVTYTAIGGGADPQFACFRFNSRKQGNAFYLALKRMGAEPLDSDIVADLQDSACRYVRNTMRDCGVVTFDKWLATALISAYVQRVQG